MHNFATTYMYNNLYTQLTIHLGNISCTATFFSLPNLQHTNDSQYKISTKDIVKLDLVSRWSDNTIIITFHNIKLESINLCCYIIKPALISSKQLELCEVVLAIALENNLTSQEWQPSTLWHVHDAWAC